MGASSSDENPFAQEYDPGDRAPVRLHIFCRLCRTVFGVTFRPRASARLRCVCGQEALLRELDVYSSEARARDFAALYEKIYRAAKDALRAANLPIPPSGKLPRAGIRDGTQLPSDILDLRVRPDDPEDHSDIASSYVGDGSDVRGDDAREEEAGLQELVRNAVDVVTRHEALTELIEHLYSTRHHLTGGLERFVEACRADMALAPELIREVKRRKRSGRVKRLYDQKVPVHPTDQPRLQRLLPYGAS
jgi:hypothetical protein